MAADVRDVHDAHAARPGVIVVAVEAERAQVAFEFASDERSGDAAAGVAAVVRAEEDEVVAEAGARCQLVWGFGARTG